MSAAPAPPLRIPTPANGFLRVVARNWLSLRRNFWTNLFGSLVDPLIMMSGIGFGLGAFVSDVDGMPFIRFLAPAFVAQAVLMTTTFENTFGIYVRMEYQKTFEAMIVTPLSSRDIAAGEVVWGALKGAFFGALFLAVLAGFGLVHSWQALLAIPFALFGGIVFASLATIYSAWAPSIDVFNFYFTCVMSPMIMFSGVFFPLSAFPDWVRPLVYLSPLTHLVIPVRAAVLGRLDAACFTHVAVLVALGAALGWIAIVRFARRIEK